jgi:hypothetical protein
MPILMARGTAPNRSIESLLLYPFVRKTLKDPELTALRAITPGRFPETPAGKPALSNGSDQVAGDETCSDVLGSHDHRHV